MSYNFYTLIKQYDQTRVTKQERIKLNFNEEIILKQK